MSRIIRTQKNKHEFSLYWSQLSDRVLVLNTDDLLILVDAELHHRTSKILRLKVGETVILFDFNQHAYFELIAIDKKAITLKLLKKQKNVFFQPSITFLLPILKRDALEQTIYGLVELGVNKIKLVKTHKVQRKWGGQKELERLHHIMIAAAEQSKNYAGAQITQPQDFKKVVDESEQTHMFFFEPNGKDSFESIQLLKSDKIAMLVLMIGPEGDLTLDEKEYLRQNNTFFCRLTATVLRAQQAAIIGAGIFRSLLN